MYFSSHIRPFNLFFCILVVGEGEDSGLSKTQIKLIIILACVGALVFIAIIQAICTIYKVCKVRQPKPQKVSSYLIKHKLS